jgi:signal transduction histidine kinase
VFLYRTAVEMPSNVRSEPSVARAVAHFALTGLAAVLLLGLFGILVLRSIGRSEAIRDARTRTELAAKAVIEPNLAPGIVQRRPAAIARLDRIVRERLLGGDVVRVKLWTPRGEIVYSDEHRLIGAVYPLGKGDLEVLRTGRTDAGISDLSEAENRFESKRDKLLEVYVPVSAPSGQKLLYEQYLRYSSITASGRRIWINFLPALLAGLLVLELVQVPLAWSMARRLREGQRERENLLTRAIESSNAERRRVAADLHDGVVQDLAGIAYGLAAAADRLPPSTDESPSVLREAAEGTRNAMRSLRSLVVDIYPPNLHTAGLEPALSDLLSAAAGRGLTTELHVDPDLRLSPDVESLLFRSAQEAVRNVLHHAEARNVSIDVSSGDHTTTLVVADDGVGFAPGQRSAAGPNGHLGLSILSDLVASADGKLDVDSSPGRGTRLRVEVPST